jgi:hypothetical protein
MEKGNCRESLARRACSAYLRISLGTLLTGPGSAMRARPTAAGGRGEEPCLFRAQACRQAWRVHSGILVAIRPSDERRRWA